ncbi:MAG: hypothetical protein ABSE18_03155 [Minisyncoccia bacterium]|jgi:hypothetical protein
MESLLHVGFSISLEQRHDGEKKYDRIDRIMFYLIIADGWADRYLLQLPTDGSKEYDLGYDSNGRRIQKTQSDLRHQLARKAFDMLCLNFFKAELLEGGRYGDRFNEFWEGTVVSERLFPIIQNFFRVEKRRFDNGVEIRNLPYREEQSHNEQQALDFLLNLANFIWKWKEPGTQWYDASKKDEAEKRIAATRVRVDAAKPWMVEVFAQLERIDVLREWILELDEACLAKLKEIALRNELKTSYHPVTKNRLAATIDEACYVGSKAAWFLKEYDLRAKEHKRLEAIREAEQKKAALDREIEKLAAKS